MMVYALPAFVLFMGTVVIASALLLKPSANTELMRRANAVAGAKSSQLAAESSGEQDKKAKTKRKLTKFDIQVQRIFAVGATHSWGMLSGGVKLLLSAVIAGGIVVGLMIWVQMQWWVIALSGVGVAFLLPRLMLLREQRRAERQFLELFPDAVDTIVRMLRAGLPMTAAIRVVGNEASEPVSTIFTSVSDQVNIGIPIEAALDAASQQIGQSDFRFFSVTVLLQFSTGGNIASTLEMISGIIRKRRAMRMKASSATSEIRLTAYVLGAIPFMTMGALLAVQPGYLKPLIHDPRGHVIIGAAVGLLALCFMVMRRMMNSVTKM